MKNFILLFLTSTAFASYSPQTIITDGVSGVTATVNSSHELETILNADSNVCKETGGNLASILSALQGTLVVSQRYLNSSTDSVTIAGSIVASNPSVGAISSPIPSFATLMGAKDIAGNLQPLAQSANGLKTDGSAVTQPVSAVTWPLPTGASTNAELITINSTLGSPFQSGASIGNTSFGISGNLPAYASTPTFNLGTLNGAATNAELITINSTLGTPFQSGGSIGNSSFGISGTLPAYTSTPTFNLGTLNGAATNAELVTINTTLGTPFQSGGSIGNSSFGISGTLPAYTTTPTFNLGNLNGAATNAELVIINSTLGTPMQQTGGSVTANAGTNLNTSALALESGGHLASIDTKTPALGQALSTASVPVVLPAAQITTLTPPTTVTVIQPTGTNLHTVVDSSAIPTGAATAANQTGGTQKTQVVDGSGNVQGPLQTVSSINYAPVTLASSGSTGSTAPVRAVQIGGVASDGNLHTFATDTNGIQQFTLGNTSKTIVAQSGQLLTSTLTSNQVILTHTTTTGKTFYINEADCSVILNTSAATNEQFGSCSLMINGVTVWTGNYKGAGQSPIPVLTYPEPLFATSGQVVQWVTTPVATGAFLWTGNFGGYEK